MATIPPLVVIVGETASGKSALGLEVARKYNGEIICADSRTIYKGMDIGTAKPTQEDRAQIPHHLLDLVEPGQEFSAADFKQLATKAITDIASRGKLPIMVGGTGLYIDSVVFDYKFSDKSNPKEREELMKFSIEELHDKLAKIGLPFESYEKNKRYLIRIFQRKGLTLNDRAKERQNTLIVGLRISKLELRHRIEVRTKKMISLGILDEVRWLGEKYGWNSEAMTGNIYRIFKEVIEGKKRLKDAIQESNRADMRLAKRQRTWFKRNPHIHWIENPKEIYGLLNAFVKH